MRPAGRRLAAVTAAALLVTVPAAAPAGAKRPSPAIHGGRGCSMLSSLVDAPDPLVRPFVPERFTPRAGYLPGHTGLVVNTLSCEDVTLNGKSFGAADVSVFWILVESPDGSPGDHLYEAWRLTDNARLAAALARYGVRLQAADVTLETQPPTPAGTATQSDVQWDGGSSYSAAGVAPVADPMTYNIVPYAYTLWQLHDGKLVKMPIVENFEEPGGGAEVEGYFAADPGSEFARMIGGAQPTNHFLFTDYEFEIEMLRG